VNGANASIGGTLIISLEAWIRDVLTSITKFALTSSRTIEIEFEWKRRGDVEKHFSAGFAFLGSE
jgi:hypothetical protein